MEILKRIEDTYPKMTRKQKKIADYMVSHAENMAFITLREFSREVEITEITILNMCKALGYESFNEVKYEFRKYINRGRVEFFDDNDYYNTNIPKYELDEKETLLQEICNEEKLLMDEFIKSLDIRKMFELADYFLQYSKIIICGRGISYLIGESISSSLAGVQIPTIKVNTELNENVYSVLPMIDKKTLILAISFPDYYFMTQKIAEYAKKNKAKIILITDSKETDIALYADEFILVGSTTRLALNTLSAPMALANLLTSAIKIKVESTSKKEFCRLI